MAAGKLEPYTDEELLETARVMGYGAVKYADLKGGRVNDYIFSYERMLDDKGGAARLPPARRARESVLRARRQHRRLPALRWRAPLVAFPAARGC